MTAPIDDFPILEPEPRRPQMSPQTGKIAEALAHAQAEMDGAAKDSMNPHFKAPYADLASIRKACRPLAKHGIAVLQPTTADGARVTVTTLLLHVSGEWVSEALTLTAAQNTPQALGSAITYGRRYGLAAMVGIAPTDDPSDDDGEAAEGRGSVPVLRQPPAAPKPLVAVPPGFATWWDDLQALADEGKAALEAAWTKSPKDLRKHLTEHHLKQWEAVKDKAKAVQP